MQDAARAAFDSATAHESGDERLWSSFAGSEADYPIACANPRLARPVHRSQESTGERLVIAVEERNAEWARVREEGGVRRGHLRTVKLFGRGAGRRCGHYWPRWVRVRDGTVRMRRPMSEVAGRPTVVLPRIHRMQVRIKLEDRVFRIVVAQVVGAHVRRKQRALIDGRNIGQVYRVAQPGCDDLLVLAVGIHRRQCCADRLLLATGVATAAYCYEEADAAMEFSERYRASQMPAAVLVVQTVVRVVRQYLRRSGGRVVPGVVLVSQQPIGQGRIEPRLSRWIGIEGNVVRVPKKIEIGRPARECVRCSVPALENVDRPLRVVGQGVHVRKKEAAIRRSSKKARPVHAFGRNVDVEPRGKREGNVLA